MRPASKNCWITLLVLALSGASLRTEATAESVRDERNTEAFLRYLRPVLQPVGGAGRIYYVGTCSPKDDLSAFPRLKLQRPSKGAVGLTAVRQIVQNDKRVTVTKDRSGMIRINIGGQPSRILQTNIHVIKLKPDEQSTPWFAIEQIEKAKEIEAVRKPGEEAFERIGGNWVVVSSIIVNTAHEGAHMPAQLKNLTFDQALDSVAKNFGAILMYEEWKGPKRALHVSLDFKPVIDYAP
jgi:hypothetical protein